MLWVPKLLPKSAPTDFSKTYNPQTCSPQDAQMLNDINQLRNNFYSTFENIQSKGDHELVDDLDWMPLLTYLNHGPDLLDFGMTKSNYPYNMSWESGSYPGKWHTITNDNEVAATTEMLFSRLICALGMLSSMRGHISALRLSVSQSNEYKTQEVVKSCTDRLLFACVRLYKLNHSANLLYPGLKNTPGPLECAKDYALSCFLLFELNFSSLMIEKTMASGKINDTSVKMISNICILSLDKLVTVKSSFEKFNCPQSKEVLEYCQAAEYYFNTNLFMSIFKLNVMMEDGSTEKTKNIETLYVENNILANYLFDRKGEMESLLNKMDEAYSFVGLENVRHTLCLFDGVLLTSMKKSVGKFEAVKGSLDMNRFKNYDLNTIRATITAGDDPINKWIKSSAGL